jgi:hypothetical protein
MQALCKGVLIFATVTSQGIVMASSLSILRYRRPVEFRIGDVVQRSWGVLSRNFFTCVLLCGLANSPRVLVQLGTVVANQVEQ